MRRTSIKPRWLNAEQQVIWRLFLAGSGRIFDELDAELRQFGLDLGEYEILVHLSEADDHELRMSDLAAKVRQSRSRLTHTVSRMESKNILTRIACPSDRRGVIAKLTDEGYALLVQAAPHHVESVRRALVDVADPADFEALGRLMAAVIKAPLTRPGQPTQEPLTRPGQPTQDPSPDPASQPKTPTPTPASQPKSPHSHRPANPRHPHPNRPGQASGR